MNNIFNKKNLWTIVGLLTVVFLFILATYFSQVYENQIESFIGEGNNIGKIIYVLITIIAIVLAPVSTMPLIPVASHLWGWVTAGVLSIIGWSIGAQIAFIIARKFGKPIVEKIVSLEKLHSFENYFIGKNLFWFVVFLRIFLPVDLLSYAIGLFSKMERVEYFWATLIGITPFALIFSYTGSLPVQSQISIFLEIGVGLGIIYMISLVIQNRKIK